MFNFSAAKAVDFVPDDDSRQWVADGLRDHVARLGEAAQTPRVILESSIPNPQSLDDLFDTLCGVQAQVGQKDVAFTLLELGEEKVPEQYVPLGNPDGQLMHTFVSANEFLLVVVPAIFRVKSLVFASIARELGRIGLHRAGGHKVEADEFEADAELAAIALGLGVWVANGSYVYENACCGGGCGIDLKSLRAGLSMPEACFGLALDGHRRGLSRRAVAKGLDPTQTSALKASWRTVGKTPDLLALSGGAPSALAGA